jgi:hypothetical protein
MVNGISRRAANAIKAIYPRFGLRDSDILLASYPKSGNTWMRFIWANIVSLMELEGREIDFEYLNTALVAEYDSHSYGDVEFDCLPRVVKTHYPYDNKAFGENRSIYIVRHPGDVMLSYYEWIDAQGKNEVTGGSLKHFIQNKEYGMPAWCEHVKDWVPRADVVVRYEDLKDDAVGVVSHIRSTFELNHIQGFVIERAVDRSSFGEMKEKEESSGSPLTDKFDTDYRFMRKGRMGEWKHQFDGDDIAYMAAQIKRAGINDIYSLD